MQVLIAGVFTFFIFVKLTNLNYEKTYCILPPGWNVLPDFM